MPKDNYVEEYNEDVITISGELINVRQNYVTFILRVSKECDVEWWSDHITDVRTTHIIDELELTEDLKYPGYCTIYARVAQQSGTEIQIQNIVVPFVYDGFEQKHISATSAQINPIFTGHQFSSAINGISWTGYVLDQVVHGTRNETVEYKDLEPGEEYTFRVDYRWDNIREPDLSYTYTDIAKFSTYRVDIDSYELENNEITAHIKQTVGTFQGQQLEKRAYKAFCILESDVDNIDNAKRQGYVIIDNENDLITVKYLLPNTSYRLYVYLDKCVNLNNTSDCITYLDYTCLKMVEIERYDISMTAKTITVTPVVKAWNASESLTINYTLLRPGYAVSDGKKQQTISIGGYGDSISFTNLTPGTKYMLVYSGIDNRGSKIDQEVQYVYTYEIRWNIFSDNIHSTYFKESQIVYFPGKINDTEKDPNKANQIKYFITPKGDMDTIILQGNVSASSSAATIYDLPKKLKPDTEYTAYMYIDNLLYNGVNDSIVSYDFKTLKCANNLEGFLYTTGTTASLRINYEPSSIIGYELYVHIVLYLNNEVIYSVKRTTKNGDVFNFDNLIPGETYDLFILAEDNEDNTSDINNGSIHIINPYIPCTTYLLDFVIEATSTRGVLLNTHPNIPLHDGEVIEYYIEQDGNVISNWEMSNGADQRLSYTFLQHDKPLVLGCRVSNMKDFNGEYDTIQMKNSYTKLLNVEILKATKPDVRTIIIQYKTCSNTLEIDRDPISLDPILVVDAKATCDGVDKEYPGISSGYKEITFNNLVSGIDYDIIMSITDGVNTVYSEVFNTATNASVVYIYSIDGPKYFKAVPYIYHNGRFVQARCLIFHNKRWTETTN